MRRGHLYGGRQDRIVHTIVNAVAINSGVICDRAKSGCAAKITSVAEASLLGMQMTKHGSEFFGGDGIVIKGVENTNSNVGRLAQEGMAETDKKSSTSCSTLSQAVKPTPDYILCKKSPLRRPRF